MRTLKGRYLQSGGRPHSRTQPLPDGESVRRPPSGGSVGVRRPPIGGGVGVKWPHAHKNGSSATYLDAEAAAASAVSLLRGFQPRLLP